MQQVRDRSRPPLDRVSPVGAVAALISVNPATQSSQEPEVARGFVSANLGARYRTGTVSPEFRRRASPRRCPGFRAAAIAL